VNSPVPGAPQSTERPNPLLPDNWRELAPLVDAVLDAAPELRDAVLQDLSGDDPDRRVVLERLVAECERDLPLLNRPAAERFAHLVGSDADVELTGRLGGRYRIEREIGRGGMARVYLAHDEKHGREVAVKVIRPDLAASLGRERFLREIAIAARLRHPNIVPLYDSGDADGVLFFVMPYEEGQSLRKRLGEGSLSIAESLGVLRDVARALAYAHEHGVVHRDVKPDNVMLSGGATLVTDFGIAKAVSAAQDDSSSGTLTQVGAGIGTPAYMSPEQAVGDPSIDHRADIYSFGCLAYEVFTGKPPFHDLPTHQIIGAHVATVPPLVTALRADVPVAVAELLARCLEKNPATRPESARDVLRALDEIVTTGSTASSLVRPGRRLRRLSWRAAVSLAAVIAVAVYLASRNLGSSAPITLAVLPFGNIAADTSVDFVAGGLAEEVASALTRVPGIQITGRSGARAYRRQLAPDVTEAGKKLKADYVMTGVVRQERGRWILSTEVTRAADAANLWGDNFNLGDEQQSGAAEAIAAAVATALRRKFPNAIRSSPVLAVNKRTPNPEAYRLYLRGQVKLARRGKTVRESADLFRASIREDTLFAGAYSGLSLALAFFPQFESVPPSDVREELVGSARRALAIDSTLAQPHVALGMLYQFEYQWDRAATEFRTAVRLDPHDVEARVQYGRHLRLRGRFVESMPQFRAARAEDPSSALVLSHMAAAYYLNHQLDSALIESRKALDNDSTNMPSLGGGATIRLANNLLIEARQLALLTPPGFGNAEYVLAKSGDTATARQRLRELDAMTPQPVNAESRRALAYLGLGDTAAALSALERATAAKSIWPAGFGVFDPMYDSIRESARFKALVRQVGLER
jgi:serine/threonine-protein kinase